MKTTFQKELHLKAHGMESSAAPHELELTRAREVARMIASDRGIVTMNEVREALPGMEFGNWSGSIFKCQSFSFAGQYVPARYEGAHARVIKVWKLK
jgi:hypothetical protein